MFKNKRSTLIGCPSRVFGRTLVVEPLSLQLPARSIAATLVVATLGDVLFARCSGSCLRINLLPTHLVGELAAELRGYGATQSALAVGCVQHLGGCYDGRMSLRVFRVLHAELKVDPQAAAAASGEEDITEGGDNQGGGNTPGGELEG